MQGSVINRIIEASAQPEPYVGMPATICHWSDRSPVVVVEVAASGKRIKTAPVAYRRVDDNGMSESQSYEFDTEPIEGARPKVWSLRKNGRWVEVGLAIGQGPGLSLGHFAAYYDYSF